MHKPLIDVAAGRFVDAWGRHTILRGVNLGGDCKIPYPDGGTHRRSDFSDHCTVSFTGRPFPLEEADAHLTRIAGWGFNCLRLLVTWEAVEHAGPGIYDERYLDYVVEVCRSAARHGLLMFIDFHQDVWSRMTGGDGAPGWIFEKLGLDFARFDAAGAAHVMQHRYDYARPEARQDDRYPMMSWSRNYRLPANGIMWTAFFAGALLTPDWSIEGRNVQTYLQSHYLDAMRALATRLRDLPEVIGFDTLNEPSVGWIGQRMSEVQHAATSEVPLPVRPGPAWTPFTALQAASGATVSLPVLSAGSEGQLSISDHQTANPDGASIWLAGSSDPFAAAGAWNGAPDDPRVLDEDFFRRADGRPIDADEDLLRPFFQEVARTVRTIRDDWLIFAEMSPYQFNHGRGFPAGMPERSVNASHWYDVEILWRKHFDAGIERSRLFERYRDEMSSMRAIGDPDAAMPWLVGEFGIPFDLDHGEAYAAWAASTRDESIWGNHATALGVMYDALDSLLLSSTQWNYTASNRNDLRIGDGWNQEDLSIYSADQAVDGLDGARARRGFSRPYVERAQGTILSMRFDSGTATFEAEIEVDPSIRHPTQIVLPSAHFPESFDVKTSREAQWSFTGDNRRVLILCDTSGSLRISVRSTASPEMPQTAAAQAIN